MNILQPLQYQSMFVPTNIDLLNQKIMRRDQEYAQNEAAMAAAMDQYAQIQSDPSAVEYKNNLLNKFRGDINKMIEDYGGDIGAIDKRTLINKMNSIRPEIQGIQRHAALKEEERKLRQQLGPWALETGIAEDVGFGDLVYNIKNKQDYLTYLSANYDKLASQVRETKLDDEGYQTSYRGLYSSEVDDKIQEAAVSLMQLDPSLDKNVALDMASEYVPQLSQGWTRDASVLKSQLSKTKATPGVIDIASTILNQPTPEVKNRVARKMAHSVGVYDRQDLSNNLDGKVGTVGFDIQSDNPINNAYWNAIKDENPREYSASRLPYNESRINELAKSEGVDPKLLKKYLKDVINNSVKTWMDNENSLESKSAVGQLLDIVDNYAWNNFTDIFDKEIANNTSLSDIPYAKRNRIIQSLKNEYKEHNAEVNDFFFDKFKEKVGSDGKEILKQFNFKSINPFSEDGAKIVNRVNDQFNNIIRPENMEFLSGEYVGEDPEDLQDEFAKDNGNFVLIGAGGDKKNGALFAVNLPGAKGQAIVRLKVPPTTQAAIAQELGANNAAIFALEQSVANKMHKGSQLTNTNYTYDMSPDGYHLAKRGDNYITVGDVKNVINPYRKKNDEPVLNTSGSDKMPYKFDSVIEMIQAAQILNSK